jgi:hypothetical protein
MIIERRNRPCHAFVRINAFVNSAEACLLRLGIGWVGLIVVALAACGDDEGGHVDTTRDRDSGNDEDDREDAGDVIDEDIPLPFVPDSGRPIPGDPPPELEGSQCAVDTNKLYEITTHQRQAVPVQLAVDRIGSRFGAAFIGESDQCLDALYLADMHGSSSMGEPEVTMVSDACTTITHTAIAYSGDRWLMALVDARMDTYDVWVQGYDGQNEFAPQRITENAGHESEVGIGIVGDAAMDTLGAMIAWVERDSSGASSLNVRPLTPEGEPTGDAVVLEPPGMWTFGSVSLSRVGTQFAALAYRRTSAAGVSEIVLDVLAAGTGERDRDPWVLTSEAGTLGTVELGTDHEGGGVIYSVIQNEAHRLWFQALAPNGRAASVRNGLNVGGPTSPQPVVGPPFKAIDASIVKLPAGYAVAFRALPGGRIDSPRIRVQILDSDGIDDGSADVALSSEVGGRTAIEAATDGRVVIGWSDPAADGSSTLKVVKLPCFGG